MKKLILLLALLLTSLAALAGGSSPGLYYGQVPTAAQWNSYFAAKLDYTPGAVNTVPYWDGSGNLLSAPISGDCTSVANVFSCTAATTANLAGGALGAVPYQSAADTTAFLLGNTTTTPQFYTSTGTGAAAQAPTLTGSTGTGNVVLSTNAALTTPDLGTPSALVGTNITGTAASLSIGGNAATATSATSATTATNIAGGTQWGVLYQSASGVTASTAAGTLGQVLTSNGTSAPTFQNIAANVLNSGEVTVTAHATTGDIFGAAANSILWDDTAGPTTTTSFAAASKAGITRDLRLNNSSSFTTSASLLIDGIASGNTVTFASGDTLKVRAITTSISKIVLDKPMVGLQSSIATTSGTSVDSAVFGSPAKNPKRVTMMINGYSTNGTAQVRVQMGTGGSPETTSYSSRIFEQYAGAGFLSDAALTSGIYASWTTTAASYVTSGRIVFDLFDDSTNTYQYRMELYDDYPHLITGGGFKSLAGPFDIVRFLTNGTDTFDLGSFSVSVEY